MGIFNFIKSQFIEVIEWTDDTKDTIVYRFPVQNKEIKMGAKLTVRESQMAVFVSEGRIADVLTPGLYELSTQNIPVLTKLKSWQYGFNSPFKAEVYFINTKQFTNQKWGTANPIMMRDAEFGMLRLRAYGIYSFKAVDPVKLLQEVFGTNHVFDTESITGHLKRAIVSGVTDLLGETEVAAIDLARYYDELSKQATDRLQARFEEYGFKLTNFFIENISLPEEVEKVLDKRTSMGVIGNIHQYAQYQAAEAVRDAAQNQGGGFAGAGVGLGAGAAIGNLMTEAFRSNNQVNNQVNSIICPKCKVSVSANQKFCSSCGHQLMAEKASCVKCKADIEQGTKFCPQCGAAQNVEISCSGCGKKLNADAKFCPECGTKTN